jgi:hypothetical protein
VNVPILFKREPPQAVDAFYTGHLLWGIPMLAVLVWVGQHCAERHSANLSS